MRARRRQSGSSLVEVALAMAFFIALLASFFAVHGSTQSMANRTSALLRAEGDAERDLSLIANLLRGAAFSSLGGFDAAGNSTAPTFQEVTGVDAAGVRVLGPVQTLAWRAAANPVDGIANPGEVTLTQNGVTRTLASRVPLGGFRVTRTANSLRVTVTTYCTMNDPGRTAATVAGNISVSLRN
jgi:type II secretory pathway component PulJ